MENFGIYLQQKVVLITTRVPAVDYDRITWLGTQKIRRSRGGGEKRATVDGRGLALISTHDRVSSFYFFYWQFGGGGAGGFIPGSGLLKGGHAN